MNQLQKNQKFLLVAMSAFSISLLIVRVFLTGRIHYVFLNWNLFLAFLPLVFTQMLSWETPIFRNTWIRYGIVGTWLLFFPNAPYILTDLFHLTKNSAVPVWFDLILILSYAWTGLIAGFISLKRIEVTVFGNLSQRSIVLLSSALIFASAFGIYLGRFLRFNSWDVLHRPGVLLGEIADRFMSPFDHPRTWGVTIGMGVLLNIMYWSLRLFSMQENPTKSNQPFRKTIIGNK